MTKKELIKVVSDRTGHPSATTEKIINTMLATITQTIIAGEAVNIRGYVHIETGFRGAKVGRNLQTGEAVEIPAQKIVKWKTGQNLKDAVSG